MGLHVSHRGATLGTEVTAASWPHSPYGPITTTAPPDSHPISISHYFIPSHIHSPFHIHHIHPISIPHILSPSRTPYPYLSEIQIPTSILCPFQILIPLSSQPHPISISYPQSIPRSSYVDPISVPSPPHICGPSHICPILWFPIPYPYPHTPIPNFTSQSYI